MDENAWEKQFNIPKQRIPYGRPALHRESCHGGSTAARNMMHTYFGSIRGPNKQVIQPSHLREEDRFANHPGMAGYALFRASSEGSLAVPVLLNFGCRL